MSEVNEQITDNENEQNSEQIAENGKKKKKLIIISCLVLALIIIIYACAVGGRHSDEPFGKYYSETIDGAYYEFDGKSTCYLYVEVINGRVTYKYVVNKEDVGEAKDKDGAIHKTYIVHISDTNSGGSHKLVYDSYNNTIWDPQFGLFSK